MKITVIKKSNGKVKTMAACPWCSTSPPVAKNVGGRRRRWRRSALQGR